MSLQVLHIKYGVPCKLALITDVHSRKQEDVINQLMIESPDYICIAGDLFERNDIGKDPRGKQKRAFNYSRHILGLILRFFLRNRHGEKDEYAYHLLKQLSKIAPVILSQGNHEWYYTKRDLEIINQLNIHLLQNECIVLGDIVFGGLSSACDLSLLDQMNRYDNYKVLLCHHPEYYDLLKNNNVDLVLAGHGHGGQMRMGQKSLFAPGQGLNPKYTLGQYDKMIVSSGLANTFRLPRFNNPRTLIYIESE